MQRTVYLNGEFCPENQARIGVEDRALQFGDGVYEVVLVANGRLVDEDAHFERLARSMERMAYASRPDLAALARASAELPVRDRIGDGFVYVQVTRGEWARNLSPASAPVGTVPTVIAYATPRRIPRGIGEVRSLRVVSRPDRRWGYCDIKTTALAGNMLARADAHALGADDAWLISSDGTVTEATAANAWIVRDGVLMTRPDGPEILNGITRLRVLSIAHAMRIPVRIAPFDRAAVASADEAFQTSATAMITPVESFDGVKLPKPDERSMSARLFNAYLRFVDRK